MVMGSEMLMPIVAGEQPEYEDAQIASVLPSVLLGQTSVPSVHDWVQYLTERRAHYARVRRIYPVRGYGLKSALLAPMLQELSAAAIAEHVPLRIWKTERKYEDTVESLRRRCDERFLKERRADMFAAMLRMQEAVAKSLGSVDAERVVSFDEIVSGVEV